MATVDLGMRYCNYLSIYVIFPIENLIGKEIWARKYMSKLKTLFVIKWNITTIYAFFKKEIVATNYYPSRAKTSMHPIYFYLFSWKN